MLTTVLKSAKYKFKFLIEKGIIYILFETYIFPRYCYKEPILKVFVNTYM